MHRWVCVFACVLTGQGLSSRLSSSFSCFCLQADVSGQRAGMLSTCLHTSKLKRYHFSYSGICRICCFGSKSLRKSSNVCLSSNSNNAKNDTTIISCYMCTKEQQNRFGTLALFCIFLCPSALQVICMSIHLSLPHKDILTVGNSWLHKDFLYHFRISDHEFCFHKPIKIFCKCIEKTFKHWKNFT